MAFVPPDLGDAERQFIGACQEQAWDAAIELVSRLTDRTAVGSAFYPVLASAHATLVTEAPNEAVACWSRAMGACTRQRIRELRVRAIIWLSEGHLQLATSVLGEDKLDLAYYRLVEALGFHPRSRAHESALAYGVELFATYVGRVERSCACKRPERELDPAKVAPHPVRSFETSRIAGYDPLAVADVIRRGIDAGAGRAFVGRTLQSALQECHWPTWRTLLSLGHDRPAAVMPVARRIVSEPLALSAGARAHLAALLSGAQPVYESADFGGETLS